MKNWWVFNVCELWVYSICSSWALRIAFASSINSRLQERGQFVFVNYWRIIYFVRGLGQRAGGIILRCIF